LTKGRRTTPNELLALTGFTQRFDHLADNWSGLPLLCFQKKKQSGESVLITVHGGLYFANGSERLLNRTRSKTQNVFIRIHLCIELEFSYG
jgi:hypothetical protein